MLMAAVVYMTFVAGRRLVLGVFAMSLAACSLAARHSAVLFFTESAMVMPMIAGVPI